MNDLSLRVQALRHQAIREACNGGIELSHRPKGMKFAEGDALIKPDMSVCEQKFYVGEVVKINVQDLVIWEDHVAAYELKNFGVDHECYRRRVVGGWEDKIFVILCFVVMETVTKKKCKAESTFCILAEYREGKILDQNLDIFWGDLIKIPVHHIGALKKLPKGLLEKA